MCQGKIVRFYCPVSLVKDSRCPFYDADADRIREYYSIWVQTRWVCCSNHRGDCTECPALRIPGNVEVQQATALECDDCGARLKRERDEEVMRERILQDRAERLDQREEQLKQKEEELNRREEELKRREDELRGWIEIEE